MSKYPNFKEIRDKNLAESNSEFNVHDGLKHLSVHELQEVSKSDRLPWHTLALNVTGDLNIGTMIRTSHCLGATSFIIIGRTKIDNRGLVGSSNYIKIEKIPSMQENLMPDPNVIYDVLKSRNLTPVFCESNGVELSTIDWKVNLWSMSRENTVPCLIMGNETGGIPPSILAGGS